MHRHIESFQPFGAFPEMIHRFEQRRHGSLWGGCGGGSGLLAAAAAARIRAAPFAQTFQDLFLGAPAQAEK